MGYYQLYKGLEQAVKSNRGRIVTPFPNAKSIILDGGNEYVNCGNDASFNVTKISIGLWFKALSFASSEPLMGKYGASGQRSWLLYHNSVAGRMEFNVIQGNTLSPAAFVTTPSFDVWHHLLATFDGATLKLYFNGSIGTNATSAGDIDITTTDIWIGNAAVFGAYFHGNIDEPRIWDRALTADEALDEYNGNKPKTAIQDGLIGNWRFDDGVWDGSNWAFPNQLGGADAASVNMEEVDLVSDVP